jgi:orotate phosphoribosyltransferase
MSVAAAIRITSANEVRVIEHAAAFARQHSQACFAISIVGSLPYGALPAGAEAAVRANVEAIMREKCAPVMQEGTDVAQMLLTVARGFGIRTLFLQSGSTVERLLKLHPPFDVVVVGS